MNRVAREKEIREIVTLLNRLPSEKVSLLLTALLSERPEGIPVSVFSTELTAFESACVFLVDEKKLKYKDVAKITKSTPAIVGITYRRAKKKYLGSLPLDSDIIVPLSIFSSHLTVFEALVLHLSDRHTIPQIAALLNRAYRTIWTVHRRAKVKA